MLRPAYEQFALANRGDCAKSDIQISGAGGHAKIGQLTLEKGLSEFPCDAQPASITEILTGPKILVHWVPPHRKPRMTDEAYFATLPAIKQAA